MNRLTKIATVLTLALGTSGIANANALSSLENLERERAALLKTLTSNKVNGEQRQQQSTQISRRLVDIERMVLRDDRIAMSDSVMAKKALASFELTFLVHARSEKQKLTLDHWLDELDISTDKVLQSRAGSR